MTTPMTPKELTPEQIDNIEEYVLRHVENPHDLDTANLIYTYRHLESILSDSQKENERLTNNETGMKIWEGLAGQRLDEVVSLRRDLSEAQTYRDAWLEQYEWLKRLRDSGQRTKAMSALLNMQDIQERVLTAQKARDGE
jgi:hypothetical protein